PPSTSATPSAKACASSPRPTRSSLIEGDLRRLASIEDGDRLVAHRTKQLAREIEVAADEVGTMRIRGKGDLHAALTTRAQKSRMGIELADALAKARGRNPNRHTAAARRVREGPLTRAPRP